MIHDIEVIIDGEKIPREEIQLFLKGGQRVMLYNARTIQDIWWNIVDPIGVFIPREGGLPSGTYELEVCVAEEISAYYELPLNMLIIICIFMMPMMPSPFSPKRFMGVTTLE